eukprot:scaffold1.g5498.t1
MEVPQGRTLAEINCQLVSTTEPTSARLPGPACPDAHIAAAAAAGPSPQVHVRCPSGAWPPAFDAEDGAWQSGGGGGSGPLRRLAGPLLGRLGALLGAGLAPPPPLPLEWHPRQLRLAAIDEADGVQIFDYRGQVPHLGQGQGAAPAPLAPAQVLRHTLQRQARALAWRPNAAATLAVGCAHGVCLWQLGRGGGGGRPGEGGGGAPLVWLRAAGDGPITSLAFHPQGHLLAAASCQSAGLLSIIDVATGACTPLRAGLEPVTLLRWSPCGCYLLAGHASGDFRMWETRSWWSQRWTPAAATGGGRGSKAGGPGPLVDAAWSPGGGALLLVHARGAVCLLFTRPPPSLQAQLMPLSLPEAGSAGAKANGQAPASERAIVRAAAWDRSGARLALALGGAHLAAGCVALYDTRVDPIVSARFIGFARASPLQPDAAGAGTSCGAAAEAAGSGNGGEAGTGVALAFAGGFDQGALFAYRDGGLATVIPLYFPAS